MTGRPSIPIPTWAENGTYPAGTDPWSGTVTKVVPTLAVRNAGVTPKTQQPAQYENSIKNSYGVWFDFLADIGLMNWSPRLSKDLSGGSLTLSYNGASRAQNFWSDYHQAWFVMGQNTNGKFFVGDANGLEAFTIGAAKHQFGVAANNGNVLLCDGVGNAYNLLPADFSAAGAGTFPSTSGTPYTQCAAKLASGTLLVAGSRNGTDIDVWRSTNSGTSWTAISVTAGLTMSDCMIVERAGTILLIKTEVATTIGRGFKSTDDGQTWSVLTLPTGFDNIESVWYSAEEDYFIALGTGDRLWLAPGPTQAFSSVTLNHGGLTGANAKAIAVAGSAIFLAQDDGFQKRTYYMSWDLGEHWRKLGVRSHYSGAPRLAVNPYGQIFTSSVLDVQQSLACAGVGPSARGE